MAALAQVNPTVGALEENADKILRFVRQAARHGATLVFTPELALCGYPPDDLVLYVPFLDAIVQVLHQLAQRIPPSVTLVVGAPRPTRGRPRNAAWILRSGHVCGVAEKMCLPKGGVFDEDRIFDPGHRPTILEIQGTRIGLHICEDSWHPEEPPCTAMAGAVDLLVNLSASPYELGKYLRRRRVMAHAARVVGAPVAYCNLVGGQDELVFDGGSFLLDREGRLIGQAKSFEEDLLLLSCSPTNVRRSPSDRVELIPLEGGRVRRARFALEKRIEPRPRGAAELWSALKLALHDYVTKARASGVVLGLSGGIDSAVTAALAVDALGRQRVHALSLPTRFNSSATQRDAEQVARRLGISFDVVEIEPLRCKVLETLERVLGPCEHSLTAENIQARLRALILMAVSNHQGWLLLSTGNKSEIATGYCTLYGDLAGAFAPLKDVPKTLVYRLARWRNRQEAQPIFPDSVLRRAPSAELRPSQTDQDTLPPYDVVDAIIKAVVEQGRSPAVLRTAGIDPSDVDHVVRRIADNEFKRRQAPPGPKVTIRAFGRDRRMPIICGWSRYPLGSVKGTVG